MVVLADGAWARNITTTGQIGDGREAAAVEYVLKHARAGDIDDVLATIDRFAYEESMLINVGDEKGALLDAAVQRANPKLALELGTYCGYSALRIARTAPAAKVYSVELPRPTPPMPAKSGRMPVWPIGLPAWSAPSATADTRWMRWPSSTDSVQATEHLVVAPPLAGRHPMPNHLPEWFGGPHCRQHVGGGVLLGE